MAGLECVVNSGTQSLASDTPETVLQLLAPTNQRLKIKGFSITMGGIVIKDLIVQVVAQTTAGTSATAPTVIKLTRNAAETVQAVAATNFSVEPTYGDVFQYKRLQSSYEKIFPLGQELIVEGGTYIGVVVESVGDTASLAAELVFEE